MAGGRAGGQYAGKQARLAYMFSHMLWGCWVWPLALRRDNLREIDVANVMASRPQDDSEPQSSAARLQLTRGMTKLTQVVLAPEGWFVNS